jgi:hypothetical protein
MMMQSKSNGLHPTPLLPALNYATPATEHKNTHALLSPHNAQENT